MENTTVADIEPTQNTSVDVATSADATRKQIRGSTLLLFGRLVTLGLNFGCRR